MKAYILKKSGPPEVLRLSVVPDPVPGDGEVLVRNHYIGVNYAEILSRKGLYGWARKRPYILGMECSGVIEETGGGVDSSRIGERVMVGAKSGAYAEKIVVPSRDALGIPQLFTPEEGAAFLVNYMTAWTALVKMANARSGENVLITAAAGGVGTAAVQIAAKSGCKVAAMAGSAEKIDLISSLGAENSYNYRHESCWSDLIADTGGMDVVLEVVGGDVFRRSCQCLKPFGRIVVAGYAGLDIDRWNPFTWYRAWRDMPRVEIGEMARRSIAVMSTHIGHLLENEPLLMSRSYDELCVFVEQNGIRPVIGSVFPFSEAARAHAFMESRKSSGKVLLKIG